MGLFGRSSRKTGVGSRMAGAAWQAAKNEVLPGQGRGRPAQKAGGSGQRTANSRRGAGSYQRPAPEPEPDVGEIIARPTRRGRPSEYEPKKLEHYHPTFAASAVGVAGLGLFDSSFGEGQVHRGRLGELDFYKVLCKTDLIDAYRSFWSVPLPEATMPIRADQKYTTDVDCILLRGNTIHLIDLKYYTSGAVTWHSSGETWLLCRDDATGKQVGKPRKMSRNMDMAVQRFRSLFPHADVRACVTLIPTNFGESSVTPGTCWPGGIPLRTLTQTLEDLRAAGEETPDPAIDRALLTLMGE